MWSEVKKQLNAIYDALADDESKDWFEARVQYMLDRDEEVYFDAIAEISFKYHKNWINPELERVLIDDQKIIIYGCGHDGKISKRVLELAGYEILCWCDSNIEYYDTIVEGKKVISPEELGEHYRDCLVIIGSHIFRHQIRVRLNDVNFPTKNIFEFVYMQGVNVCGNQYFDVFMPYDREVFVDAGAYNGDSVQKFIEWKQNDNYKVYFLELSKNMCQVFEKKRVPNVEIVNCAAWNEDTDLCFKDNLRGASVFDTGNNIVTGRTIDSIVRGGGADNQVTFIKMEIVSNDL